MGDEILRKPVAALSCAFLLVIVGVAVFAPLVAPYEPNASDLTAVYEGPSASHWFGTDEIGRDVASRLVFGARTSFLAAIEAVAIGTFFGVGLGLSAGYLGGRLDVVLSRINDALMSVPSLILALSVLAVLGAGLTNAMLAVGIIFIPRTFRVVRASALEIRSRTFIEALEAIGCRRRRILWLHVLPNSLSPLLVVVSVSLGTAILAEASLSYLGLGVRPPTPSWGAMLADASSRPDLKYLLVPPGVLLALTIAALTVLGDVMRDAIGLGRVDDRG